MGAQTRPISVDTGWPFLLSGLILLGATVLIPALDDLAEAQWHRDRALTLEHHRAERIQRHERYLAALEEKDPGLILALASRQLNRVPEGSSIVLPVARRLDASVFPELEPAPVRLPPRVRTGSTLENLTTSQRGRPWLIAVGTILLLIGLLPPTRART